jgi:Holliday junction DNA helicase RuvA
MIARLSGVLAAKKPTHIVVDVGGVGYRLFVSLTTFYTLPDEGEQVTLAVHTHVREEAMHLFGFADEGEKGVFEKLIGISKVGPKLALTILSGLDYKRLAEAVRTQDKGRLSAIPGVGRKTADRLIVELADKLADVAALSAEGGNPPSVGSVADDAVEGLASLGYKKPEATKAVEKILNARPDTPLEKLLREALGLLAR